MRFDSQIQRLIGISNSITTMANLKSGAIALLIGLLSFWNPHLLAADQITTITEEACTRIQGSEIIWHLSEYRWLCCIPKNENEYETCIPISDMEPLPKTGLKPFPPETTKTIKPGKK